MKIIFQVIVCNWPRGKFVFYLVQPANLIRHQNTAIHHRPEEPMTLHQTS